MVVDFSHYSRISLPLCARSIERGRPLTDEGFKDILDAIEPPLFEATRMTALRSELCWFEPRAHKGRPPKGSRREELAAAIAQLDRPDVPQPILTAMQTRLMEAPDKLRLSKPWQALQKRKRADRNSSIFYINRVFVEALVNGTEPDIPELAEFLEGKRETAPPKELALRLTQAFLRERLGENPPGIARMRNIISEKEKSVQLFVKARSVNVA